MGGVYRMWRKNAACGGEMQNAKCKMNNPKRGRQRVCTPPTSGRVRHPFLDFTFYILHFAFFF
jgi:hypothetical protein